MTRNDGTFSTSSNESNADVGHDRASIVDLPLADNVNERRIVRHRQSMKTSSLRSSNSAARPAMKRNQTVISINRLHSSGSTSNAARAFRRSNSHSEASHRQRHATHGAQDRESKRHTLTTDQIIVSDGSEEDLRLEKTGWLNIKHWLSIADDGSVQSAANPSWKRFWIWLKDAHLHFFNDYLDRNPHLILSTIDCLCYPYPEYRHRQHVFSFTIYSGDAYLFQSSSQCEIDHWIECIHSNSLARISLHSLRVNLEQLESNIIYEKKMLQSTRVQTKTLSNTQTVAFIARQMEQREQTLEKLSIDHFRKSCYLSALTKSQQHWVNSTDLLSQISSPTKLFLCDRDAFTPCGLYAHVISRRMVIYRQGHTTAPQTIVLDCNPPRKIILSMNQMTSVQDLLKRVTEKLDLPIDDYFLYCHSASGEGFVPDRRDVLDNLTYTSVEIRRKTTYQIVLNDPFHLSGLELNQPNPMALVVRNVRRGSEGERLGAVKGDEVIMLNNSPVKHLDIAKLTRYLQQVPITLTLRSARLNQTFSSRKRTPSAPKHSKDTDRPLSALIKPMLSVFNGTAEPQANIPLTSDQQQIHKIILELVETETSYVQDLRALTDQYIEPLRNHTTVLPPDLLETLHKSVQAIHEFQSRFLDGVRSNLLVDNVLIATADTFIRFSKDFKIYSTYCVTHLRINRLLNLHHQDEYLRDFLAARNPSHQHSLSFQSYLIKPVQRILRYPLFLQQLLAACNKTENSPILSKEISKLKRTIKLMNKVNKYINSMQKLYEDFGQAFESFTRTAPEQYHKKIELNLPELHAYGEMNWINMSRFVSKKHGQCLRTFCFVFRSGCLLLVREPSTKKNQETGPHGESNKNGLDRFVRFLPMKDLKAEIIHTDQQLLSHTWQLIHTDPVTQLSTYYHFANKDAQTFVKTINHCLSKVALQPEECLNLIDSSDSPEISPNPIRISSSRSCHDFSPRYSFLNGNVDKQRARPSRQSPSPVWKRRGTTCLRRRPLSMSTSKNANC